MRSRHQLTVREMSSDTSPQNNKDALVTNRCGRRATIGFVLANFYAVHIRH
jgi:hypothetical protein